MPLSILDALFREIIDHPDDDTPRLVLADWLDDHGDAASVGCAEFIRVQCRLEGMALDHPERPALEAREVALRDRYPQRWAVPLRGRVRGWTFRRGLVSGVSVTGADLAAHGADVFDRAPVQAVHLYNYANPEATLDKVTQLARIRELSLGPTMELWQPHCDGAVTKLLRLPAFAHLRRLRLRHTGGRTFPDVLGQWAGLTNLEALDLCNGPPTGQNSDAAFRSERLPRLRELRLGWYGTPPFRAGWFRPAALTGLLGSLEALEVAQAPLADVVALLAACPAPRLRALALPFLVFPSRGRDTLLAQLANSPLGRGLLSLDLRDGALSLPSTQALAAAAGLANLVHLGLNRTGLDAAAAEALAGSPHLSQLRYLDLGGHRSGERTLGDRGAAALAAATGWPSLAFLDLSRQVIGNRGVAALLRSRFLEQLYVLDLSGNWLDDTDAERLLARGPWPRLVRLDVRNNAISPAAYRRLRDGFGERVSYAKAPREGIAPPFRP